MKASKVEQGMKKKNSKIKKQEVMSTVPKIKKEK
jgi:hypothetical protein